MPDIEPNIAFRRWTRDTVFCLTLRGPAVPTLLAMHRWEAEIQDPGHRWYDQAAPSAKDPDSYGYSVYDRGQANYLEKRGLIRLARHLSNNVHNYVLTEAGRLTARLLLCAGFETPKEAAACAGA